MSEEQQRLKKEEEEKRREIEEYLQGLKINDDNDTPHCQTPRVSTIYCLPGSVLIHKENWSDNVVRDWINKHTFPDIQGTRDSWPCFLKRFWSYYITGDYPENCGLDSVIGCIVLMTPDVNDKFEYKPLLTFNSEKLNAHKTSFTVGRIKTDLPANIVYPVNAETKEYEKYYAKDNFGNREYTNFNEYINTRLQVFPTTGAFSSEDRKFLDLSTAIALMCLQAMIKSKQAMEVMFFNKKLKFSLRSVLLTDDIIYAPPCECFFHLLKRDLEKSSSYSTEIMKPLMLAMIENGAKSDQNSENNLELLNFTCMSQTKFNGLIMIKLTLQVMEILKLEWNDLVEYLLCDQTRRCLELIRTFLIENVLKKPLQYSWYWCRIFDNSYYYDLSPKEHPFIATVFGKIIELDTGSKGIWDSYWAKNINKNDFAIKLGTMLYENFKQNRKTNTENLTNK